MSIGSASDLTDWFNKRPRDGTIWYSNDPADVPGAGASVAGSFVGDGTIGNENDPLVPNIHTFAGATARYWYFEVESGYAGQWLILHELDFGAQTCMVDWPRRCAFVSRAWEASSRNDGDRTRCARCRGDDETG